MDWEWFYDEKIVKLFIYLLLKANHEEKKWNGIVVNRGELATSISELSDKCNLSIQVVRTCLYKLSKSKNVTSRSTNKFTILTICNYDDWQDSDEIINKQPNNPLTNEQQTNNKQITTTKELKNKRIKDISKEKEIYKEKERFNFFDSLLEIGVERKVAEDWLSVRKAKKAANTETAFNAIAKQISLSGITPNECIKTAAENSWQGFKADWLNKKVTSYDPKTLF